MIQSHGSVGSYHGARTTAAQSAYKFGGYSIKISSDGDITFLFTSSDSHGTTADAQLSFM
jgi:hypothetical protein